MGLGSLIENGKRLLLASRVMDRLKQEAKMGRTWSALYALFGFVATAIVAKLTLVCPGLTSAFVPALIAAVGGGLAHWAPKPDKNPGTKSLGVGSIAALLTAVWGSLQSQLSLLCGVGFVEQLPTLLTAGFVTGLGLYLQSPRDPGGDDKVSGPTLRGLGGAGVLVFLAMFLMGCGSLAQVRVGGEAKPAGPDQKVVEGLVCQARDKDAEVYLGDRGASRAEITERIERARQDTAGRPGCACRETTCVGLKPATN